MSAARSTTATTRPRRFMTPRTASDDRGTRANGGWGSTTSRTAPSGSANRSLATRNMTCRNGASAQPEARDHRLELDREVRELLGGARHLRDRGGLLRGHL